MCYETFVSNLCRFIDIILDRKKLDIYTESDIRTPREFFDKNYTIEEFIV